MKTIQGDLLEIKQGLICHQVNCKQVAGAGLALQIRKKWPEWYQDFMATKPKLGQVTYFEVAPGLFVANLYAQEGYGRTGQHTDYVAFQQCVRQVAQFAQDGAIYLPVGIGCGLAGGEWDLISMIIAQELPHATLIKKRK